MIIISIHFLTLLIFSFDLTETINSPTLLQIKLMTHGTIYLITLTYLIRVLARLLVHWKKPQKALLFITKNYKKKLGSYKIYENFFTRHSYSGRHSYLVHKSTLLIPLT